MGKTTKLITFIYICYSFCWFYINLGTFPDEIILKVFPKISGLLCFLVGVFTIVQLYSKKLNIKSGLISIIFGSMLVSVPLFIQELDIVMNFYQICGFILFTNGLVKISEDEKSLSKLLPITVVFLIIFTLIVFVLSDQRFFTFFDYEMLLVLFVPLQYTALIILLSILIFRRYTDEGSIRWLIISNIGLVFLFFNVLMHLYSYTTDFIFTTNAEYFLHTTGVILILMGLLGFSGSYDGLFLGRYDGITYLKNVSYKIPTSLN